MKSFLNLRESTVKSADRKPEKYTKPDGRVGVRMVPVDKEVVKTESKEIDEISLSHLTKKIADSGGMKQVAKANKADKLKKDLEAMKKRMATEQMDDEDDDENECPHCDMEDGEHEKDCPMMQEKTLTPAEKKKREEIAKLDAEREAGMRKEEVEIDESFASNMNKAAKKAHADAAEKIKKMGPVTRDTLADINAKLGNTTKKEEVELDEAAPKMKGDWLKKERERNRAHDAAMGRTPTGRKKPVRQMTSTQKSLAKMRGEEVELDEVLDTPKAMDSYRNKAKYSKDRAANSAAAKMLRNPKGFHSTDTSDELKTMDKRAKGLKMADKAAARKTRAMMIKKEEVELDEGIEKMSHSRLKWHMNTGVPHGSYSKDEMKAERDRRMQHRDSADAYKKAKPSMSEEAKPDAADLIRHKQQMASISTSDKEKLAKIRAMLNKEKKK